MIRKITRMFLFTAIAIYLTSLWNKGFSVGQDPAVFAKAVVAVGIICYLVLPISKIVFLPLNILTLGIVSFLFYIFTLHLLTNYFPLITIKEWVFEGTKYNGFIISKVQISYIWNLVLSSLSISFIINALERLL